MVKERYKFSVRQTYTSILGACDASVFLVMIPYLLHIWKECITRAVLRTIINNYNFIVIVCLIKDGIYSLSNELFVIISMNYYAYGWHLSFLCPDFQPVTFSCKTNELIDHLF